MRQSSRRWKRVLLGERILLKMTYICLTVLLLSQLFLLKPEFRVYLSQVDKLEGEQISLNPAVASPNLFSVKSVLRQLHLSEDSKTLTIKMLQPARHADVFVSINGKKVADFSDETLQLKVQNGDYLEINATAIKQHARFIIYSTDAYLTFPRNGMVIDGEEEIIEVGKIKFAS